MSSPLFVQISDGWINAAEITRIRTVGTNSVVFELVGSANELTLNKAEGQKIINRMKELRPDWFV